MDKYLRKHYDIEGKCGDRTMTCPTCLKFKSRNDHVMRNHRKNCGRSETGQNCEVPEGDKCNLKFRNTRAQFKPPLTGSADFETTVSPEAVCNPCKELYYEHLSDIQIAQISCYHTATHCDNIKCQYKQSCEHKSNIKNANLKAVAHFGVVLENDNSIFDQALHYGPNAAVDYIQHLLDNETKFTDYIATNIPRKPLTQKQRDLYENQIKCGERWCKTTLDRRMGGNVSNRPVIDHDHLR